MGTDINPVTIFKNISVQYLADYQAKQGKIRRALKKSEFRELV